MTVGASSDQHVESIDPRDRDRAMATLELAFAADPVMRWFWPAPDVYRAHFSRFVAAAASGAFELGTAQWLGGGVAVALWLPPGRKADEDALVEVILESVDAGILADLSGFAEGIRELHPEFEHWYLPVTGVDPHAQGRGLGTILLRHVLATCDRDGLPAYLEASTGRSRALYAQLGFEELGVIQVGSSPTVWPMLRAPRQV